VNITVICNVMLCSLVTRDDTGSYYSYAIQYLSCSTFLKDPLGVIL
jgi:hypothetical protein